MKTRCLCSIIVWGAVFLCGRAGVADSPAPDFNQQIAPLLRTYCTACHNADDKEGGLVLDSYAAILQGGKRGASLVSGDAARSRLYLVLTGAAQPAMPPAGNDPPKPEELALLKAWIDAGAPGPSGAPLDPTVLISPQVKLTAAARAPISAIAWSPDGKLLALAGYGRVRLVSPATRDTVRELSGLRGNVNAVSFSKDGTVLVTAEGEPGLFGEATILNAGEGKVVRKFTGHRDSLYAAVLSPDGKLLATSSYDERIILWDAATGSQLRTLQGHNGAVYDLAFSPNGRLLASASGDRTLKLWDVASGARLDTFGQPLKEQYAVAYSPDGRFVAGAGVDNRIRLWRMSESAKEGTNELLIARFAHQAPIIRLAWSPDGAHLASAAEDRTLKIWDARTITERRLLAQQPDWTPALAFSPDGKKLAVGRLDGTYALYDAASGQPVPVPKPELTAIEPRGLQRGATTRVKLTGKALRELAAVGFNHASLSGRIVAAGEENSAEAWAEITPAADLPPGAYELTVSNSGGTSGAVRVFIDDIPQVTESEPNDAPASATAAALPASFWGTVSTKGDADYYAFDAQAGQTLVLDLASTRLGGKLNGAITVADMSGRVIADSNDFDEQADPLLAFQVPADGRYLVRVADLTLGSSADHWYRLSVGPFAYVTGVFPLSVPPDAQTAVQLAGFNLPPAAKVSVKAGSSGEVPVPIDPGGFRSRQALKVQVGLPGEVLEAEPNDTPQQATVLAVPGAAGGRIWAEERADLDLFKFTAQAGQPWVIETQAAQRGAPTDTKIEVLDAAGRPVPRLLLQAMRDSYITFRGIDSKTIDSRVANWEEMELNEFLYMQGEVCKLFRLPQGPDSGFLFYGINGQRRCYFDTSASAHALDEPCYIVQVHPVGTQLVPNGLPVFRLYYANDDDGDRKLGRDSRIMFTAPATGEYLVRVSDVRGRSGDRFAYRLVIRRPQPDFAISIGGANPVVNAGSGKEITFQVDRRDGFEGPLSLEVTGLPPGFSISQPLVIEEGHFSAKAVLFAAGDAPQPEPAATSKVTARAVIEGKEVVKEVGSLGVIKRAEKPQLLVRLEPAELTIRPGTTITAMLSIERNGFNDEIRFDVNNLPHGVYVDNIGLNGVLILAGQTQRQVFITARPWVEETSRPFHVLAPVAGNQVSSPIMLHVKRD
jgi:WD40 repeat protein